MKTNKELLELLLQAIHLLHTGLCGLAMRFESNNVISREEYYQIKDYIRDNRLTIDSPLFGDGPDESNDEYYWICGDYESRKKWLEHHIKICKF